MFSRPGVLVPYLRSLSFPFSHQRSGSLLGLVCGFSCLHAGLGGEGAFRLVFSFFWSGKRELVSRSTAVQSHLFGGFSIVNVKFKVYALLGQWVKRLAPSP